MSPVLFRTLLALFVGFMMNPSAVCQVQEEEGLEEEEIEPVNLCDRFYVDPTTGSDSNSGLTPTTAFFTVNFAIFQAAQTGQTPAVVVCLPGVYSANTNGEQFPINLRHRVSVQGTNALNTVFDCDFFGPQDGMIFVATAANEDFTDTYYDGFTIKNAHNAMSLPSEGLGLCPTISNICLVDNEVGIYMNAIDLAGDPSPYDTDSNDYVEHRPRIVNLTFANNDRGVLDVIDNNPGGGWGEGDPAFLNCLFVNNTVDVDGSDLSDFIADSGTISNAFCSNSTRIKAGRLPPLPGGSVAFDCSASDTDVFMSPSTCDYRLKPTLGGPAFNDLVNTGNSSASSFSYHGGLTVIDPIGGCFEHVFDADMEEYCNPRIERGTIDIGADELGQLIIAGYQANTTTFSSGAVASVWLTPLAAVPGQLFVDRRLWTERTNLAYLNWLPQWIYGARPRGTIVPTPRGSLGNICVSSSGLMGGSFPGNFIMGTPNSWIVSVVTLPSISNNQVLPIDANSGSNGVLTNLQSFIVQ